MPVSLEIFEKISESFKASSLSIKVSFQASYYIRFNKPPSGLSGLDA